MARSPEYLRGYQAGRQAQIRLVHQSVNERRFDQFMAAAITGLIQAPWGKKDKSGKFIADSDAQSHADTAAHIARAMLEKSP